MQKSLLDALAWRYATKKFDPSKKVSDDDMRVLLDAMRLTPTSFGLQPWRAIVVTNPEIRQKLQEHSWNQPQVVDASHLIVFAVKKNIDDSFVDEYVDDLIKTRGIDRSMIEEYIGMMKGFVAGRTPEALADWAARQAYIVLGNAMMAAAMHEIDACPMEGFDSKKFDEILSLDSLGLSSVVLLPVGYRSSEDQNASFAKVRFPKEEMIREIE